MSAWRPKPSGRLANNLVGWACTRLETMAADRFWMAHALVAGVSALILFALQWPIKRAMAAAVAEGASRQGV